LGDTVIKDLEHLISCAKGTYFFASYQNKIIAQLLRENKELKKVKESASDISLLLVKELSGKVEDTEITKLTNKIIGLLK